MALASTSGPLHAQHDLVMLDLDGVVYVGPDAVPGAREALSAVDDAGTRLAYLTNNASRTAGAVAAHLRDLGMPVDDADVVTSAQAVARMIGDDLPGGSKVLVIGGEGLRAPLEEVGLQCVSSLQDEPAAVVQGFHPDVGWKDLAEAAYAVGRGLPWYASNTDLSIPTARGTAPGNGALVQAVASATAREPLVAGKPHRPLFDETLARTGASTPLMVGDRVDTDIDGAIALQLPSLLVLSGVCDLDELAALEPAHRPTWVGHDVGALLEVHEPVAVADGTARCADATAVVGDDVVRLGEGDHRGTAALRAVTALAWHVLDTEGRAVRVRAGSEVE